MKILAVEFSSELRSVAIAESNGDSTRLLAQASERGGRATRGIGLVEKALAEASCEREAIELIAIGIGPGSYTGIRAGIALAQGWQLARKTEVVGISSVEAMVREAQQDGICGAICVVIDAQRDEFYMAPFRIAPGQVEAVEPLKIVPRREVEARAANGFLLVGPDAGGFGSCAKVILPTAPALAQLIPSATRRVSAAELEPIYLRETTFVKAPPARHI